MPLPEKFTVAVYMPQVNADFYHPAEMEAIASKCPDIEFKFFGNPMLGGRKKNEDGTDTNIEYMGYVEPDKMEAFVKSCSAIIRFPRHDGLPLSVLEFLTAGRYSIQSVPIEGTVCVPMQAFTVDKIVAGLNALKDVKEPNEGASKYWREALDHEKYKKTMQELFAYNPKEYWENRADSWVNQAAAQPIESNEVKEVFQEAKQLLGNNSAPSVVDAGCGDGRWLPFLKEWGIGEYRGFDISAKLIEAAKQKYPDNNFHVDTVEEFRPITPFDIVFSYTTLEHITEAEFPKAVENLKKMGKYLLLIEPTDFKSRHYCHKHDYAQHFDVVKEVALADKKILLCKMN
jgi:SAM-dependent methyltransferase